MSALEVKGAGGPSGAAAAAAGVSLSAARAAYPPTHSCEPRGAQPKAESQIQSAEAR
jgi:hypothetical protein